MFVVGADDFINDVAVKLVGFEVKAKVPLLFWRFNVMDDDIALPSRITFFPPGATFKASLLPIR